MDPTLKIFEDVYFVLKMGIFHYYVVSLLEGKVFQLDPLCFEGSVFFFSVAKAGNSHFTLMSCGIFFSRKHFQCLNLIFRSRSEQISKHHLSFKDFLAFCTQTNSWDIWFQFDQWHSFFNWVLNREKHPQKHITIGSDIQWHPIPLAHKSVKIRGVFFWCRGENGAFSMPLPLFFQPVVSGLFSYPRFCFWRGSELWLHEHFFLEISQKVMVGSVENDPTFYCKWKEMILLQKKHHFELFPWLWLLEEGFAESKEWNNKKTPIVLKGGTLWIIIVFTPHAINEYLPRLKVILFQEKIQTYIYYCICSHARVELFGESLLIVSHQWALATWKFEYLAIGCSSRNDLTQWFKVIYKPKN